MTRLCVRVGGDELNSHSVAPCRRVVDCRALSWRGSQSPGLMYCCGKAIHVSRREDKAFKQVLGMPPGGFRHNVVEVQQNTTFPGGSRQSGSYPETGFADIWYGSALSHKPTSGPDNFRLARDTTRTSPELVAGS